MMPTLARRYRSSRARDRLCPPRAAPSRRPSESDRRSSACSRSRNRRRRDRARGLCRIGGQQADDRRAPDPHVAVASTTRASAGTSVGCCDQQRADQRAADRVGRRPVARSGCAASQRFQRGQQRRRELAAIPRDHFDADGLHLEVAIGASARRQTPSRRPRSSGRAALRESTAPARASDRCRRCRSRGRARRESSGSRRSRRPDARVA